MESDTSDFKVGNTSFNTHFMITIPDYGEPVPECNTTAPIIYPANVALWKIVNMIERGLHVQFEDKKAPEKIYFFLTEYNRVAAEINNRSEQVLNPIASKAEEYFRLKLNYQAAVEDKARKIEEEQTNPFAKRIVPPKRVEPTNLYTNEAISARFKKKQKPKKFVDDRDASEHKMFEMFSQPGAVDKDGRLVENTAFIGGTSVPEYFDDLDFGV